MNWLYFVMNCTLLLLAAFCGWQMRRLRPRRFAACMAAAAALMCLRIFLHAHPEYEQYLLRWLSDDYIYFSAWEAPLAALMVFGLAAHLPGRRTRRLVVLALGVLAPLFLWDSFSTCLQPRYVMAAQFDADGVCRQGTSYSCGPAAAVMMLKFVDAEVSEGEMANLCLLRPDQGVTALELCRGLNIALRPWARRAVIERIPPDELDALRPPFLAQLRRGNVTMHCVVVVEVRSDTVLLADPARGRSIRSRSDFLRDWTGIAITVRPWRKKAAVNRRLTG